VTPFVRMIWLSACPLGICFVFGASVARSQAPAPIFDTQIMPVLTKSGCNAGACHGAAAGRGGMALSLWGADSASDYETLVSAFEGRRVNRVHPAESLLLLKSSGQIDHGGNVALSEGSAGAKLLLAWIEAGARRDAAPPLISFTIRAPQSIDHPDSPVKLQAIARFAKGPEVDVTPWTVFTTSDATSLTIEENDQGAHCLVKRRGRHTLIGRFLDRVEPAVLVWPMADAPIDLAAEEADNLIDEEILKTLSLLRIPASGQADDAAYLRRIRLDLTGRLPTPAEVDGYLLDRSANKKAALVDRLLASGEFADYWTLRQTRLLGLHSLPGGYEGMGACTTWLRKALIEGMPLDRWASALLLSTGDTHQVGAAYFSRMANDARSHAELVSRVFLGARLQCANCHNHPLDRWTQDDYHGLAAIFSRLSRGRVVQVADQGAVSHPRTGEPAIARLPGVRDLDRSTDNREAFAQWLLAADNPQFAKAQVNGIWKVMVGRGLVEPVDDLRATNPPTHPELFDRLARDFIHNGYNLKGLLRRIALSRTYGRSAKTLPGNETDDRYHSHALARRMEPEVLLDALCDVTGAERRIAKLPMGLRAVMLYDPRIPSSELDLLGRCSRGNGCDTGTTEAGLAAQLHRLNGELLNAKIGSPGGRLAQALAAGKTDRELIESFYLLALSRRPSQTEQNEWLMRIQTANASERQSRLEDFLWALLNCKEFRTNH